MWQVEPRRCGSSGRTRAERARLIDAVRCAAPQYRADRDRLNVACKAKLEPPRAVKQERARPGDRTGSGRTLSDRMCCAVLRGCCDSAGTARCLYGMCMFSRVGKRRRLRVQARARVSARKCKCKCRARVCACMRRDGGACGDGSISDVALAGIGISRNRDIPMKDLGSSETESLVLL